MRNILFCLTALLALTACEKEVQNTVAIPERTEEQKQFYARNTCAIDARVDKTNHKDAYKCGQSAGLEVCKEYFDVSLCSTKP